MDYLSHDLILNIMKYTKFGFISKKYHNIENDFKISPQDLENAITPNTKMIIFSSPCNPSGSVYSVKERNFFFKVKT